MAIRGHPAFIPGTRLSNLSSASTSWTSGSPRVTNLDGYMDEPTFKQVVGETVWQKAEYVRKAGNNAVHGTKAPEPATALDVMRELYHVLYWTGRTYLHKV